MQFEKIFTCQMARHVKYIDYKKIRSVRKYNLSAIDILFSVESKLITNSMQ